MNRLYDPKNRDEALIKVFEECAEVIQCASKIQRFGWDGMDPRDDLEDRETNEEALVREMYDVELATSHLTAFLWEGYQQRYPFAHRDRRNRDALEEENQRLTERVRFLESTGALGEVITANKQLARRVEELESDVAMLVNGILSEKAEASVG